jgi:predicted Fe-S protein YdhL (DUF1289 family)
MQIFWPSFNFPPINLWNVWNMTTKSNCSPCVGKCFLDIDKNFCVGCGRTPIEIEEWTLYNFKEQSEINANARQRLIIT